MIGKTNSMSGGDIKPEIVKVQLKTNQSSHTDIVGAKITVDYANVSEVYTWEGSDISIKIPPYLSYTISLNDIDGYKTPDIYNSMAIGGTTKSITLEYKCTIVTIKMDDNQPSYNDISAATATISSSGMTTKTISNGGTAKVPTGNACTITWSVISGYKTPDSQTFTASGTSATKTGTYLTEVVSVSLLSGDAEVSVIGATFTINGASYTWNGTDVVKKIAFGTTYTITASDLVGFTTPSTISFVSEQVSRSVVLTYSRKGYLTTIRLNQTVSDPATMITRTVDDGAIEAIRSHSHRYTGKKNNEGIMVLKQLDDNDGTKYLDGSAADLTTLGTDVWMKLPKFYYKAVEASTDVWDITFQYSGTPEDQSWKVWDGKDLIGVYEAYSDGTMLYSVSGQKSTGKVSQADFVTRAHARGNGFTLVRWKHHNIMAFLFYALYGNTDSQAIVGAGTGSESKTTGQTNALSMIDTDAATNGNSQSINFWGLENWWGNKYEWMEGIVVNNLVWNITEDDGSVRTVQACTSNGYISKIVVGEHLDIICKTASGSETTGFCDYYVKSSSSPRVARRSYNYSSKRGGVAYSDAAVGSSSKATDYGSRLAFRGEYVIE